MEVHHHAHSADPGLHRGKKKWTDYIWEFLMLFLAVFCGFLAEYQLEHMIEKQREKQYMESLAKDLKADTAMLNTGIARKYSRINAIDSVFMFFYSNKDVQKITAKFLKTLRRTSFDQRLTRNSITINQLKNSGGMRLIRNKEVADSISTYDFNCERFDLYNEQYITNQQLDFRHLEKMVKASELSPWYIQNTTLGVVANVPDSTIISINLEGLNEYLNLLMQIKAFARQEIINFEQLRNNAVNLIMLIRKEYRLSGGTPLKK